MSPEAAKEANFLQEIGVSEMCIRDSNMSDKVVKLIEDVKSLTVLELSELVKALEEEFGVSAAAPVAVAAAPAAGGAAPAAAEEKTEFDVVLKAAGANKIAVIKVCLLYTSRCV